MATGRTLPIYQKVYINGYELSCYVMDTGEQGVEFGAPEATTLCDPITGVLATKPTVTIGPINGVFDDTATSGLHVLSIAAQGARRNVMVAHGIRAAAAFGDPCFAAPMLQSAYKAVGSEVVTATINLAADATSGMLYRKYWGHLLHAMTAETGANSANTNVNNGAATTAGGWLMYQIYSITGAGTVTISVDDSANGTDWLALSGATSGAIATASAPTSGIVQLATTATVRQYLRFQFAKAGSASAAVFALAFIRG